MSAMQFFARETPSSVMFDDLHHFGGLSNTDSARILLSSRVTYGSKSPRDRAESRTYLSRNVVHATPDMVNPSDFADFDSSTLTLCSRILARQGNNRAAVVAHYSGDAALRMMSALAANGLDPNTYQNEVDRLLAAKLREEKDRAPLLVMLFCCTGCLANPGAAVAYVEDYSHHKLANDIATVTASYMQARAGAGATPGSQGLGLIRVINGSVRPPVYPLNPLGARIGALVNGPSDIRDVEADVSREHLVVWRDDDRWLCQGRNSTNGTLLVSGLDGQVSCVEPPRKARKGRDDYPPQEIREGDRLKLGASTEFLALRVTSANG